MALHLKQEHRVSKYTQYEYLKSTWILRNPGATAERYEAAMRAIAKNCGV